MIKDWIEAIRPRTLPASASPVLVAGAYGWHFDKFQPVVIGICLLFAILAQIASNLANDYFDFKKGIDDEHRTGPKRAVASGTITPKAMLVAALVTLGVACAVGCTLICYGGWILLPAGDIIALFALAYSAGPYPLSCHGLGDLTVFVFFGLIAVDLTYFIQAGTVETMVWLGSAGVGLLSVNILLVNNYRDMENDAKANKVTTVVMFGRQWAELAYLVNGIAAVWLASYEKPAIALFLIPYLVIHYFTWKQMRQKRDFELNPVLSKTARNLLIFSLLLILALVYWR